MKETNISSVLPIVFGLLTSLCFAIASLLAQRGYHRARRRGARGLPSRSNAVFLLGAHFILYSDTRLFAVDNLFSSLSVCSCPGLLGF